MSFKKILVALDESVLSQSVFDHALEMAPQGAHVMLVHCLTKVVSEPVTGVAVELGLYPELIDNAYQAQRLNLERRIEQVRMMLAQYAQLAQAQGIPTEFDYKIGEPGVSLCQIAATWKADVIILGRRGRTGLAEALLGSVSNYVMHHAPCSVFVVQQVEETESPPVEELLGAGETT